MTTRPIIIVPDPVLRQVAKPVDHIDDNLRKTLADMADTMYAAPGIGLAANQVGLLHRFIVVDVNWREDDARKNPMMMINPKVLWMSEESSVMQEGCLSIPQQYADVERPARVRVGYMDLDGKTKEIEGEGLLSHCLQHEIDHLDGKLFVDYLSTLKRGMILRRVAKLQRDQQTEL
jgi:peptide deformylase